MLPLLKYKLDKKMMDQVTQELVIRRSGANNE